ncbi:hypothetical protein [Candidatus Kuenenia stuttgartiensis]|uniref:hypothetical protein n=2 Tax=Candidatus Kuenenia TaxID=380738 RepID=UPI0012FDC0FF|nr:hypothetical protein [Candidatus Kuenenia stuttgartiensis]
MITAPTLPIPLLPKPESNDLASKTFNSLALFYVRILLHDVGRWTMDDELRTSFVLRLSLLRFSKD